jgi:hypothetical protein
MRFHLLATVSVVLVVPLVTQGQETTENLFKKAKIGDYAVYKVIYHFGHHTDPIEISTKQSVTAKSEKEVTMQAVTTVVGGKPSIEMRTIDLTKPHDPTFAGAHLFWDDKGKWEKTGETKEKVKVGDKTYDCNRFSATRVTESGGAKVDESMTVWLDKSVLSGLVKMEISSTPRGTWFLTTRTIVITESGSAK